jgi:peptidoglycan/LPS O-acetylase OafA/YrhL
MSEEDDFYTIQRAAQLLDLPTEKVHGLVRKGKLKAHRDKGTGRWLLDVRSVHDRLKASWVGLQGDSRITTTSAVMPDATQDFARHHEAKAVRLPYLPGLDGLRALAVIAVLLYHADLHWIPGGFLGVDVFFVISGYLIASLLLAEWRQQGRIDIKAFWLRRARRLLPALYLLLMVTLAFAVVLLPEEVARLRNDAIAAFGYVTNWYLVFGHQSYFETIGRPSLLQHLWSLAVEEQFYVLWPLVFAAGMVRIRWLQRRTPVTATMMRWRSRRVLIAVLAGAAASALLMAFLYRPDIDPSRLYYGTDTRATALLVGVALAFVWVPGYSRSQTGRTLPLLLDLLGLGALGGLIWFCLWLDESRAFLFWGGFALVAITTAVVIMVVVHPRTYLIPGLLGWRLLRWVGLRSYGIYLWHWPIFMVTRPELDVPLTGLPLLVVQLAATVVLAGFSYRFVETPIRTGALARAWRALREAQGVRRWRLGAGWAGAVGTAVAFCVVLGMAVALAQPPAPPSYLSVAAVHTEGTEGASPKTDTEAPVSTPKTDTNTSDTTPQSDPVTPSTAPTVVPAGVAVNRVTAIGDSVMVGAAEELNRALGNPAIQADVGFQAADAIAVLQRRRAAGQLGDVVVVHIGTNGTFTDEQFDDIMSLLAGVPKVVFVNVKAPRPWEQPNNNMLSEGVRRYPNAVLVDWHAASVGRPEFFVEDGIHLQPEGQRVYADLIAASVNAS